MFVLTFPCTGTSSVLGKGNATWEEVRDGSG